MFSSKAVIIGNNIEEFVPALGKVLKKEHLDFYSYEGEEIKVFIVESYFFRVNSNLVTLLILGAIDHGRCEMGIVSGGGADGLLMMDLGAERRATLNMRKLVEKKCAEYGLLIEFQENGEK